MTTPQPVRALALAKEHLPRCKDADYILRLLDTKARRAQAKAPAKEKRVKIRRLLRAAGEKPKTKSDWMREADKWFSRFIRLRDSRANRSVCFCCTCRKMYSIHEIENGHCIRRENFGTRYHEQNCNPQGPCCNKFKGGDELKHIAYIEERYGQGTHAKLLQIAETNKRKPSSKEFQAIAEKYEKKVLELGGWPTD